jgi:superfamily II DNA or RNA helicase
MFCAICKGAAERGSVVWILAHRQELLDQISTTLNDFEVPHGIIGADYAPSPHRTVQVASVFSLVRRMASQASPDVIVIDEAHHAILSSTWGQIVRAFPRARLLGVTATPKRLSGEGLGDIFDHLVLGPTPEGLIANGCLAPVRVFAPPSVDVSKVGKLGGDFKRNELSGAVDRPKVVGDAVEHYERHTPRQRAIVFCVSLDHAAHVTAGARAAGLSAVMIDGKMDRFLRRDIIKDFQYGKIKWLVSVDLVSEGFDCPGAEVGISLRPTQSVGLWLQQCGRILRPAPGKSVATILDHAGNTLRHGLPTEARDWDLSGSVANGCIGNPAARSVRVCPRCFSATRSGAPACRYCGLVFKVESRSIRAERGELKEVTAEDVDAARRHRVEINKKELAWLTELGKRKGYRNPEAWAEIVLKGRAAKKGRKNAQEPGDSSCQGDPT